MAGYTEKELIEKIEVAAVDMQTFYRQSFINCRGKTLDTDEYYTEIIARWCCTHLDALQSICSIRRETSYRTKSHSGIPTDQASNREEELIAMAMFRQGTLPPLGCVIDYQTPLKNKRTDHAGKVDLLSYDGTILRFLELKEPDSTETMLRCVLEGFTYLKTADLSKLLSDFSLPKDTEVKACPFVFLGREQHKEMQETRPQLKRLMKLLDSHPYYIKQENEKYIAED